MSDRQPPEADAVDRPIFWGLSQTFLKSAIGLVLAGSTAYLVALLVLAPDQKMRALLILVWWLLTGVSWLLLANGRIEAAVRTLAFGIWTYVTVTVYFLGGVSATNIIIYPLAILLVGWMIGVRAAVAVTLLTMTTTLALVIAENRGLLPAPPTTAPLLRWVVQCTVFAISAVLVVYLVRSYRTRLEELRALGRDLTRRTEEVQAREADLNRAQAVAHIGSWVFDIAADEMTLSAETCRIFGVPEGARSNHDAYLSRVHADDRDAAAGAWQAALDGGAPFDNEHRIMAGDSVRWVRQKAELEYDSGGKPVRCVGIAQDITERKRAEEALREREIQLQCILGSTADGILAVDGDGGVIRTNRRFAELWRIPAALLESNDDNALLGYVVEQLIDPEAFLNKVKDLYQSEAEYSDTVNFKDGRVFERFTAPLILNRLLIGRVWSFRDITERIRANDAIRASDARSRNMATMLRLMCDNVPDMIWAKDLEKRYLFANKAICDQLLNAANTDEPTGKTDLFFAARERTAHPDDPEWHTFGELCQDSDNLTLAAGIPSVFEEFGNVRGRHLVLDVHKAPFHDADGNVIGTVGSARDITERKIEEEMRRESESRLSAVFHSSPIGISITRMIDGTLLDTNEAALQMYGYRRDEVIGRTVFELGVYAIPAQRDEVVKRLKEHGRLDRFPIDLRHKSGSICMLEMSVRVIELEGEQCLVSMMLDVTERKRLEQANLQAQKLQSLGTLAGGIAHDFNNILSAIRGNADLAAEDLGPSHIAAESLEEIRKAGARASELVRRIMAFGQPREASLETVQLGEVVDEVLRLLRSTLPAGIVLKKEFNVKTPDALADTGQVHEAIVNLTTNAAYAIGPRAGAIEYRLEPAQVSEALARDIPGLAAGSYARLMVSDDGCGMDAATLERIFDAFYTTKPVGEGAGLGLSMVHGIMRSHGGAVTVESAPGAGTRFTLYFPAATRKTGSKLERAEAQMPPTAGKRVLYVDDEEALVFLANRVLSRLGHTISGYTDPEEALAAFQAHPQDFDIVVTDLSMPHMSGFDLARELLAVRPDIPILMTTGYIHDEDVPLALAAGIRELVLKPVTIHELAGVLDRLFRADGPRTTGSE